MASSHRAPRSCCPIASALDLLGDRWTLVILRDVLLAGHQRFSDFAQAEGITPNILTERLRRLEAAGVLVRRADPSDGRRVRYLPTPRALDLIPTLLEVGRWGLDHTSGTAHVALFDRARHDRGGLVEELRAAATRRVEEALASEVGG